MGRCACDQSGDRGVAGAHFANSVTRMAAESLALAWWQRIEGGWYRLPGANCQLHCAYCAAGISRMPAPFQSFFHGGELPSYSESDRAEIVREVGLILDATPPGEPLHLTADDLLTFDGFIDVLEEFKRHSRHMDLITPGLKLADLDFARTLSGYDLRLTITYLAHSDAAYQSLTQNGQARSLIEQALRNLKRVGVPFLVNTVITRAGCAELVDIARFLFAEIGVRHFTAQMIYLEQGLLDNRARKSEREATALGWEANGADLFAPFGELDRQLALVEALCVKLDRRVAIVDVPLCQLRPELIRSRHFEYSITHHPQFDTDSPTAYCRSDDCAGCPLDGRCCYISAAYLQKYPSTRVDAAKVGANWGPVAARQRGLK